MYVIFETLGKTLVAIGCGIIQLISVVFSGFGLLFTTIGGWLDKFNAKILTKVLERRKKAVKVNSERV